MSSESPSKDDVVMEDVSVEENDPDEMDIEKSESTDQNVESKNAATDSSPNKTPSNLPTNGNNENSNSADLEEDAKRVIEMLRSEDVSDRVAAASRLESVAAALGHRRSREVCSFIYDFIKHEFIFHFSTFYFKLLTL